MATNANNNNVNNDNKNEMEYLDKLINTHTKMLELLHCKRDNSLESGEEQLLDDYFFDVSGINQTRTLTTDTDLGYFWNRIKELDE